MSGPRDAAGPGTPGVPGNPGAPGATGNDGPVGATTPIDRDVLAADAPTAAVALLGGLLVRTAPEAPGGHIVARIVETEAYHEDDPASHSHAKRTARSEPMFWGPGTAYVYRSYGIHWCLNVTVEPAGTGAAVLVRAARVLTGVEVVRARRDSARTDRDLLRGPGRLTVGLAVDGPSHDRSDLLDAAASLRLATDGWRPPGDAIRQGPRVGVTHAPDLAWRWWLAGAPEVSPYRRSPRARPAPR
jgi:DNA-3-methyladenine glycosylase